MLEVSPHVCVRSQKLIPKALIEVAGKPFICHQLSYLYAQGIRHVVLCGGYLGEKIQAVVGDGSRFGLAVSYSFDGAVLLGTGGALKKALPLLGDPFFVLYGDSFLPINFASVEGAFRKTPQAGLMTLLYNNDRWDKSNVLFRDGELIAYNKQAPQPDMAFIDYGLGILTAPALASYAPGTPVDLAEVYQALSANGELAGHEVQERFYEIGSPEGLAETEKYFWERGQMTYTRQHLNEVTEIIEKMDTTMIRKWQIF